MDENSVYYKIYKSKHIGDKLTVVCMQWFDEYDYEEERFFKNKHGKIMKFFDENKAINWLLANIKEELIDPDYLPAKQDVMTDDDYYK